MSIYDYISLGAMLLMSLLILVQTRGASLGAGLGGAGEVNTTRRGTEKTIFQLTVICALIFSLSLIFSALG
jgi:preprotein translocase subunit SecG